jgi:hypothetical protein
LSPDFESRLPLLRWLSAACFHPNAPASFPLQRSAGFWLMCVACVVASQGQTQANKAMTDEERKELVRLRLTLRVD